MISGNGIKLSGSTIHPGQNLVVRKPEDTALVSQTAVTATEEENKDGYFYYTVQQGDTLIEIAGKYEHVSVDDLKEAKRSYSQFELKSRTENKNQPCI
jgi:LysM repeat protein